MDRVRERCGQSPAPAPGGRLGGFAAALAACCLLLSAGTLFAQVRATYLYTLSNFSGTLRDDFVRVAVDQEGEEIYVVYQSLVRIFNPSGMEIFSFGDDLDLGRILDVAVDPNGDIVLLSYKDSRSLVTRCNFRGEPIGPIEITGLPASLTFGANKMILKNGLFYFVSLNTASVIITDANGRFREHVGFLALIEEEDKQKSGAEMFGFSVDNEGNMFFTIPVLFKAYKCSPDKTLASFGRPGSAAGRFGVIAGITTDSRGNVIVVDKLKSAIMVFDKDFTFLIEFGYRGTKPGSLFVPDAVVIDKRDRIYVSQGARRGVSVFALAP
jgi:DNA-binding beta-propeller fold protein YncE